MIEFFNRTIILTRVNFTMNPGTNSILPGGCIFVPPNFPPNKETPQPNVPAPVGPRPNKRPGGPVVIAR